MSTIDEIPDAAPPASPAPMGHPGVGDLDPAGNFADAGRIALAEQLGRLARADVVAAADPPGARLVSAIRAFCDEYLAYRPGEHG